MANTVIASLCGLTMGSFGALRGDPDRYVEKMKALREGAYRLIHKRPSALCPERFGNTYQEISYMLGHPFGDRMIVGKRFFVGI